MKTNKQTVGGGKTPHEIIKSREKMYRLPLLVKDLEFNNSVNLLSEHYEDVREDIREIRKSRLCDNLSMVALNRSIELLDFLTLYKNDYFITSYWIDKLEFSKAQNQ